jgi:hypothetical protein
MKHGDMTEQDIMQAAQFAIRMRHAIRSEENWDAVMDGARKILDMAKEPPEFPPVTDVALLAVAFLQARKSARKLEPGDEKRVECEAMLDRLCEMLA